LERLFFFFKLGNKNESMYVLPYGQMSLWGFNEPQNEFIFDEIKLVFYCIVMLILSLSTPLRSS